MTDTKTMKDWQHSAGWGGVLVALYLAAVLAPLALAFQANPESHHLLLTDLALGCGLVGLAILCMQFVLTARMKWLERPFGLDIVTHFHRTMAVIGLVLLLLHPLLLLFGEAREGVLALNPGLGIWLGRATLIFVLGAVVLGFMRVLPMVPYQIWRLMHKFTALILVLAFVHAIMVGPAFEYATVVAYFSLLFLIALGIFAWRNLVFPFSGGRDMKVRKVIQESPDTTRLVLSDEDETPFDHLPGQFGFLKLYRENAPSEEHPFTICSPGEADKEIEFTIKASGDYTNTIDKTREGCRARVEGPFGRFSHFFAPAASSLILIAGGVGITPFRSMLTHIKATGDMRSVALIYGNATEQDILFRKELDEMPDNIRVVHVLSDPGEDWQGERGFIKEDIIEGAVGALLAEAHVYVCGPPPMMELVLKALRSKGVPWSRIHREEFGL